MQHTNIPPMTRVLLIVLLHITNKGFDYLPPSPSVIVRNFNNTIEQFFQKSKNDRGVKLNFLTILNLIDLKLNLS